MIAFIWDSFKEHLQTYNELDKQKHQLANFSDLSDKKKFKMFLLYLKISQIW
jgi:hypothetical protein